MKKILGYIRKADNEYGMTARGDVIAVGVSGGKDSLVLLKALSMYAGFAPQPFAVKAITVDMRFGGTDTDFSTVSELCSELGVEYHIVSTDIAQIVFDIRQEKNPCSLCARMRRGALLNAAEEYGCNKLALGHSADDALETFFMNLFYEGRIDCFSAVTEYDNRKLALIRPLILAPERDVISCAKRNKLPVIASVCPEDKTTVRAEVKKWLSEREKQDKGFKKRVYGAVLRDNSATKRNGTDVGTKGGGSYEEHLF